MNDGPTTIYPPTLLRLRNPEVDMKRRGDLEDLEINVEVLFALFLGCRLSDAIDELSDEADAAIAVAANPPTNAPARAALDVIVGLINDVDGRPGEHAEHADGNARSSLSLTWTAWTWRRKLAPVRAFGAMFATAAS